MVSPHPKTRTTRIGAEDNEETTMKDELTYKAITFMRRDALRRAFGRLLLKTGLSALLFIAGLLEAHKLVAYLRHHEVTTLMDPTMPYVPIVFAAIIATTLLMLYPFVAVEKTRRKWAWTGPALVVAALLSMIAGFPMLVAQKQIGAFAIFSLALTSYATITFGFELLHLIAEKITNWKDQLNDHSNDKLGLSEFNHF